MKCHSEERSDVGIRFPIWECGARILRIVTPVCALVRNDSFLQSKRERRAGRLSLFILSLRQEDAVGVQRFAGAGLELRGQSRLSG